MGFALSITWRTHMTLVRFNPQEEKYKEVLNQYKEIEGIKEELGLLALVGGNDRHLVKGH